MVPPETQKNEIEEGTADQRESYDEEIDPDFDFPKVNLNFTITTFLLHWKKSRQVYRSAQFESIYIRHNK